MSKAADSKPKAKVGSPIEKAAESLDDRQIRGTRLYEAARQGKARINPLDDSTTLYWSSKDSTRAYTVVRKIRNIRGTTELVYNCNCPDAGKQGRRDCEHRFAERMRRGEILIEGANPASRDQATAAVRRPPRKRFAHNGLTIRTSQRHARIKMIARIPKLVDSLKLTYEREHPKSAARKKGGQRASDAVRAAIILSKVAEGLSLDHMRGRYEELLSKGIRPTLRIPHRNTFTEWINDATLTPVLFEFLRLTAQPFRQREVAAIIDSTKMSQLRTAHSRLVDYGTDQRPTADWMRMHALIGVETMIIVAVDFSKTRGEGTHDINFIKPLVEEALQTFCLSFLLGDKAYLSHEILGWLWERGLRATIPLKRGWSIETKTAYFEALKHLANWYDERPREFDEVYRLRPKIEGLFSIMKRMADGYCWSRGRLRKESGDGEPCTAWINEAICKCIYINLRTTVTLEEETGYQIDYLFPSRCFPKPDEPLIKAA